MAKEKTASVIAAPIIAVEAIPIPVIEEKPSVTPFLVKEAFGDFRRGNVIHDPELIKKVLASPQARFITPLLENK